MTTTKQKHPMNFLIFDNELRSLNLIDKFLSDFYHVKLITTNETISTTSSSSPFLYEINHGDISNAAQVIEHLSKHDHDPYDAILIFNLTLFTHMDNIIKIIERLKRKPPRVFLIFVNQQNKIDQNFDKLLKKSSKLIQWTIIFCNEINSSTPIKYRIEKKLNPINQQPISATDLLDFLWDELHTTKKHLNDIIFLY